MSREAVEIVRAYNQPLAGVDVVPMLEEAVELHEREGLDAVRALQPEMSALVDDEDLGECVLSVIDVQARGRQGISVQMRVFQAWEVRDGRIAWSAAFADRQGALDAAAARAGA